MCLKIGIVLPIELLDFKVLLREGFYHTVAADIFLDKRVQGRKAVPDAGKGGADRFRLPDGGQCGKGQNEQHAQRQFHIYRKDHTQGKDKHQHIFIDCIDNIGRKMPYGVHIARLAAHQVSGLLPVKEGEIFHQKFAVEAVPHIIEHAL